VGHCSDLRGFGLAPTQVDDLILEFCRITGVPAPTSKSRDYYDKWVEPVIEIAGWVDGRGDDAVALMTQAVRRLRKSQRTIARPKSILETCRAIMGEVASGAFRLEMSVAEMVDLVYQKMEGGE